MGQLMGIMERVDWEGTIPRNIRFMRIKMRVDPWLPVIASFMLRVDEGLSIWIQCRYERVHKLCTRCGPIGHTCRQCTHNMNDIERMLYRQRLKLQDLHQVQYRFDALQPQFTNELRAFHRRRWTTQIRFGHLNQNHGHAAPGDLFPENPNPSTPSSPSTPQEPIPRTSDPPNTNNNHTPRVTQHNPDNHLLHNNESTLNATINLLNLNSRIVPPIPTNSLASTNSNSGNLVAANPVDPNLHAIYPTIQ